MVSILHILLHQVPEQRVPDFEAGGNPFISESCMFELGHNGVQLPINLLMFFRVLVGIGVMPLPEQRFFAGIMQLPVFQDQLHFFADCGKLDAVLNCPVQLVDLQNECLMLPVDLGNADAQTCIPAQGVVTLFQNYFLSLPDEWVPILAQHQVPMPQLTCL